MSADVEDYLRRLTTTEPIREQFRRYGIHYAWWLMLTSILATLATLLAGTIINVAIPHAMGAFGVGQDQAQWLATANLASGTAGMLLTAWSVERLGMRLTLLLSLAVFTAGCLIGGFSTSMEVMVLGRILQGVPSGIITPLGMSVIFQVFPPGRQGLAMGVSSIGIILAPALGPAVGGMLVDSFSWRYVFFLGVPISLLCIPLTLMFAPGRATDSPRQRLDVLGLALASAAITLLLVGLTNGEREGWNEDLTLLEIGSALLLFALFVLWQRRASQPLMNLAVFRSRQFSVMVLAGFVLGGGLFGSTYILPLFLQVTQGLTPTDAGLALMPAGLVMALVFPLCGRLADRVPARTLMSAGIVIFAVSFVLMTRADANTGFWLLAWWMVIGRIGIALAMPSLNIGAIGAVPPEMVHQASGTLNFLRQLGGAFGVNLLSMALERRHSFHIDALAATQRPDNVMTRELLGALQHQLERAGLTAAEQVQVSMNWLGQALGEQAMMLAFRDSFWITAAAFLATLVPLWAFRLTPRTAGPAPRAEATS